MNRGQVACRPVPCAAALLEDLFEQPGKESVSIWIQRILMSNESERVVWEGWFSLCLPTNWTYSEDQEVITLYDESVGAGALQISLIRRQRPGAPSSKEALELTKTFATNQGWNVEDGMVQLLQLANSPSSYLTHVVEDEDGVSSWKLWQIIERQRAACITSICAAAEAETELTTVTAIVNSFRWETVGSA